MKIKVSNTTNIQLDWLVAKCEGKFPLDLEDWLIEYRIGTGWPWCYSTDWSQAGPIIERERIELLLSFEGHTRAILNRFDLTVKPTEQHGPTPLIAAMRCLVASKLGEEVEAPDDLGEQS